MVFVDCDDDITMARGHSCVEVCARKKRDAVGPRRREQVRGYVHTFNRMRDSAGFKWTGRSGLTFNSSPRWVTGVGEGTHIGGRTLLQVDKTSCATKTPLASVL